MFELVSTRTNSLRLIALIRTLEVAATPDIASGTSSKKEC